MKFRPFSPEVKEALAGWAVMSVWILVCIVMAIVAAKAWAFFLMLILPP